MPSTGCRPRSTEPTCNPDRPGVVLVGVGGALGRVGAPVAVAAALTLTLLGVSVVAHPDRRSHQVSVQPQSHVDVVAVRPPTTGGATVHPCRRRADVCVDAARRLAWLQHGGTVTYGPVPVALGRPGHRTPIGRFHVAWKAPDWTSTEYGIPMPWSVFFAAGGIAFHAGPLNQRSHGCVHLRLRDARHFFNALDVGDVVIVR